MPSNIISDPATGHQIAYADGDGKVFDIVTNELVAWMQDDGNLYSPDGELLGQLYSSDKEQPRVAPEAFVKLLSRNKRAPDV